MKIVIAQNFSQKLHLYKKLEKDFKIRQSPHYQEIISSSNKIIFNSTNTFKGGLFLFSMVKRDMEKYLKENGNITPYDELPVNMKNESFEMDNKIIGVDINNAYWSVAHLKGYISAKTYNKGLEKKEYKVLRLSSLSSLGKDRHYEVYEGGKHIHNEIKKGNVELQNLYLDIRYTTYGVMYEISNILGNNFKCWKTDCIYFKDTERNRKMVTEHIESYGLEWKIE